MKLKNILTGSLAGAKLHSAPSNMDSTASGRARFCKSVVPINWVPGHAMAGGMTMPNGNICTTTPGLPTMNPSKVNGKTVSPELCRPIPS